jgi:hypothetical protein
MRWVNLTREWSDPTCRNLPWFFFHCKSTHNKIHCQNFSCCYALQVFLKNFRSYPFFLYTEPLVPEVCTTLAVLISGGRCITTSENTYIKLNNGDQNYTHDKINETRVEAGSNTSTVTLRVVGGDEMGSLKSETVKYGPKSQGTRTEKDCAGKDQRHIQKTDLSSRQRGRPTELSDVLHIPNGKQIWS